MSVASGPVNIHHQPPPHWKIVANCNPWNIFARARLVSKRHVTLYAPLKTKENRMIFFKWVPKVGVKNKICLYREGTYLFVYEVVPANTEKWTSQSVKGRLFVNIKSKILHRMINTMTSIWREIIFLHLSSDTKSSLKLIVYLELRSRKS